MSRSAPVGDVIGDPVSQRRNDAQVLDRLVGISVHPVLRIQPACVDPMIDAIRP
jgi:hypothetical protein